MWNKFWIFVILAHYILGQYLQYIMLEVISSKYGKAEPMAKRPICFFFLCNSHLALQLQNIISKNLMKFFTKKISDFQCCCDQTLTFYINFSSLVHSIAIKERNSKKSMKKLSKWRFPEHKHKVESWTWWEIWYLRKISFYKWKERHWLRHGKRKGGGGELKLG